MVGSMCREENTHVGSIYDIWTDTVSYLKLYFFCSLLYVQSLVAFPKLKRQVLSYDPSVSSPKDFTDSTLFYVNQEFSLMYVMVLLEIRKIFYILTVSKQSTFSSLKTCDTDESRSFALIGPWFHSAKICYKQVCVQKVSIIYEVPWLNIKL